MLDLSIEGVVFGFLYILAICLVFGALYWLVNYLEGQLPSEMPIYKGLRIFLAIAAVLVFIGFVLHMLGHPIIRLR